MTPTIEDVIDKNGLYENELMSGSIIRIKKAMTEWASLHQCGGAKTDFQIAWELSQITDKPFFIDIVRALIRSYDDEEISLSKLVEELNIMSIKWHESPSCKHQCGGWVKASERLPEKEDNYWCRIESGRYPYNFDGSGFYSMLGRWKPNDQIEWLDESPIEPCGCEEKDAINKSLKNTISFMQDERNEKDRRIIELEKELQRIYEKHGYDSIKQLLK